MFLTIHCVFWLRVGFNYLHHTVSTVWVLPLFRCGFLFRARTLGIVFSSDSDSLKLAISLVVATFCAHYHYGAENPFPGKNTQFLNIVKIIFAPLVIYMSF